MINELKCTGNLKKKGREKGANCIKTGENKLSPRPPHLRTPRKEMNLKGGGWGHG